MLHAKVFAILLFIGLSAQNAIRFELLDDNDYNVSQKCENALNEKKKGMKTCDDLLIMKWETKTQKDLNDFSALQKDVCTYISELKEICINMVKVYH